MNDKLDVKIIGIQNTLYRKAIEIFEYLRKKLDPDSNDIDLDRLRMYLSKHKDSAGLNDYVVKMLSSYNLIQQILKKEVNDKTYNIRISQTEFCDFITAKHIKNLLFHKNLNEKRESIEDIYDIFHLMGGSSHGISQENIGKKYTRVMKLFNKPENYFKDDYDPFNDNDNNYKKEANEIITLLSRTDTDKLSTEDFVNAISSEFLYDFDLISLDK